MLRFGVLVSVFAMSACGGGSSIAFEDLPQALREARCEQQVRCGLYSDKDYCVSVSRFDPDLSTPAALAAKKLNYDDGRGQACVDAIKNLSCDTTTSDAHVTPPACFDMYEGKVADGAACSLDTECTSGTCDFPNNCPELMCCVGMCHVTSSGGKAGAACAKDFDCNDGLVCGADRTCHAPAKDGAPCGSDRECADKLACTEIVGDTGTCRALPHKGEPCPYHRCAEENLYCDDLGTHSCVAYGGPGDPCPMMTGCGPALECDATTKTCKTYPTLGMPCDSSCSGDAFCMIIAGQTEGTCMALLDNDQMCDDNQWCKSGFCEDGPVFRSCIDPYICY